MILYSVNIKNACISINNSAVYQIQALFNIAFFPKKSNEFSILGKYLLFFYINLTKHFIRKTYLLETWHAI